MLVPFTELLSDAERRNGAVGGFTAYNVETATAVLDAADRRGVGVLLLISEQAFSAGGGRSLASALCVIAQRAPGACCVQLDHVSDLPTIEAAFEHGIGAVMADGSLLSYEQNLQFVAAAVRVAARFGAGVEAELGRIEGDEEVAAAAAAGKLTDPDQAAEFLARGGADCLAVSIGNAHGRYRRKPELDIDRLELVHRAVATPLSLHGASGLPDDQVTAAIVRGIRKVNVNTELRDRYFDVLAERLPELRDGARLLALQQELIAALSPVVDAKLALFGGESTTMPEGA